MKKQSFFLGAVMLTISSIVSKIIGAIYKIPLTNLLGPQGMGIYYIIFPVYAFLITFVSSSYTLSISRMVSSEVAKGDYYMARRVFYASLFFLAIIGSILCALLIVGARIVSDLQGVENAYICYLAIAPAIVMVALSSCFKGYFQGLQNMAPSSIAQVLEQVVKLAVGFSLATILSKHGALQATMGAVIGISISEAISLLFFVILFFIYKGRNRITDDRKVPIVPLSMKVFKSTLPFLLSSVITPLSLLIDSFLIVNILKSIGFDKYFSTALLGLSGGVVSTLVNLPTTLSSSICITLIPYITYALSRGDDRGMREKSSLAIKVTLIIAIPCTIAFLLFSKDIIALLYSSGMSSAESRLSVTMLTLASINVLYISILQITTALLQAMSKAYVPVISLSVALVIKVITEVFMVSSVNINIFGAIMSAGLSYALSAIINLIYLRRHLNFEFSLYHSLVAPVISGIAMSLSIYLSRMLLSPVMSSSLSILSSFFTGAVIYLIMIIVTRAFKREEYKQFFHRKKLKLT